MLTKETLRCEWTHLSQVETGTVTTVIIVPVHVKDLLALDGEQARQDTFGQTRAQHDNLHDRE
jgi:hypothetical protein